MFAVASRIIPFNREIKIQMQTMIMQTIELNSKRWELSFAQCPSCCESTILWRLEPKVSSWLKHVFQVFQKSFEFAFFFGDAMNSNLRIVFKSHEECFGNLEFSPWRGAANAVCILLDAILNDCKCQRSLRVIAWIPDLFYEWSERRRNVSHISWQARATSLSPLISREESWVARLTPTLSMPIYRDCYYELRY